MNFAFLISGGRSNLPNTRKDGYGRKNSKVAPCHFNADGLLLLQQKPFRFFALISRRTKMFTKNPLNSSIQKTLTTILSIIAIMAMAFPISGSAFAQNESSQFGLTIRAYIDGYSQLVIQGSDAYWHHIGAAAPGRLDFVNLPTYLNGDAWYPEWPDIPNAENRECNCDSINKFSLDTSLPENQSFVLNEIEARNSARISQQPNADNNYTLIIDFDDWPPDGAAWYEVTVETITPLPWLIAFPENDAVEGWEWPEGATVKLTVNGTTDPDWSGVSNVTTWGDPRTYVRIEVGADFNLQIGDVVELTDGMTTITHTIKNLAVLDANQDDEFIGGTSDAGETVSVWPHGHDQEATVQATAGQDGSWQASFKDLFDLVIGTCGRSQVTDPYGNATTVDWCAPKPWFAVFPEWDVYVQAFDYPLGATVHLAIDDPATGINPDFEADQITEVTSWNPNGVWAVFSLPPTYDMKPGDIVTLTSTGITPRVHTVQNLWVDMVNVKYDTITGTADTGAVVQVWPWDTEQDYTVEATTKGGRWQVDYGALGFDLVEGISGRAQISINGNVTAMDWDAHQSFDIYAFNPQTKTIQQITYLANTDEYNPSWSSNGKKVAHDVVRWNGTQSIYITEVATGISTPLVGAQDGGNDAVWSPNGKWIAFDRFPAGDSSLYLVPSTGGTRIFVRTDAVSPDWAPNGKRLAFQQPSDGSIRTIAVEGGKGSETFIAASGANPTWSPDGNWIAYENNGDIWKVHVNILGKTFGNPIQVTSGSFWDGQPTWSPNSTTIVYHSGFTSDWDLWTVPTTGGIGTWLNGAPEVGDYDPSYAKNSQTIGYASSSPDGQAPRTWAAAFTGDLPAESWSEGVHTYHFHYVEGLINVPYDSDTYSLGVSSANPLYDGNVLLRWGAIVANDAGTCTNIITINPGQATRFHIGWTIDGSYADARAFFDNQTAQAIWDGVNTLNLELHEVFPWTSWENWSAYTCTFTAP
jgi:Tol biopolymer transport system component